MWVLFVCDFFLFRSGTGYFEKVTDCNGLVFTPPGSTDLISTAAEVASTIDEVWCEKNDILRRHSGHSRVQYKCPTTLCKERGRGSSREGESRCRGPSFMKPKFLLCSSLIKAARLQAKMASGDTISHARDLRNGATHLACGCLDWPRRHSHFCPPRWLAQVRYGLMYPD